MAQTEAAKRAVKAYKEKSWKKITIEIPIAEYEALKAHLDGSGESLAGFIRRMIKENT